MSIEYFPSRAQLEDVIAEGKGQPFADALQWGQRVQAAEYTQLIEAIAYNAQRPGALESRAIYEATLYLLDAWIGSQKERAA